MVKAGYTFNGSTDVGPDGLYYGDFIYADLDGDGDYGDGDDFYLSGHSYTPKYNFGVNLSLAWKGLDFYMLEAMTSRTLLYGIIIGIRDGSKLWTSFC